MLDDALIQIKAAGFKAVAAAGVTTVEDGHVVLLCHPVDGGEEAEEILLRVDVLFAVGREEDVFAFLQTEAPVHIAGFYLLQVFVKHLCHGAACDVGALLGKTAVG